MNTPDLQEKAALAPLPRYARSKPHVRVGTMGHLPIGLGAMMALAMSMDPHGMRMATREAAETMPKETAADRERIAAAEAKRKRKAEKRAKVRSA